MKLLLLISGNKDMLSNFFGQTPDDFVIEKIDEKDLSRFAFIRTIIKRNRYDDIYFGTLDIKYQRFTFFIHTFILLSHARKGAIIDSLGRMNKFSFVKYFFRLLPLFLIESIASVFVVIYFYIKFPVLRWLTLRNR